CPSLAPAPFATVWHVAPASWKASPPRVRSWRSRMYRYATASWVCGPWMPVLACWMQKNLLTTSPLTATASYATLTCNDAMRWCKPAAPVATPARTCLTTRTQTNKNALPAEHSSGVFYDFPSRLGRDCFAVLPLSPDFLDPDRLCGPGSVFARRRSPGTSCRSQRGAQQVC